MSYGGIGNNLYAFIEEVKRDIAEREATRISNMRYYRMISEERDNQQKVMQNLLAYLENQYKSITQGELF